MTPVTRKEFTKSIYNNIYIYIYIFLRVNLDCLSNSRLANGTRRRFLFTDLVGTLHAEEVVAAGDQGGDDFALEADDAVVFPARFRGGAGGGTAVGRGITVGTVGEGGDVDGEAAWVGVGWVAPRSPRQRVIQVIRKSGRQTRSRRLAPLALGLGVATEAGQRVDGFKRSPNGLGRRR